MQEKENISRILEETKDSITKDDPSKLKELSNQTINTASRTHDPDNIAIAVIVYSIGKILERKEYREYPGWREFHKSLISCIDHSINAINKHNEDDLRVHLELIRKKINKLSGNLKIYIQDVFRKASINKASKIYEHGISMEKTAKLLGISLWELANYSGQTNVSNVPLGKTYDVKSRIKLVMEMFS